MFRIQVNHGYDFGGWLDETDGVVYTQGDTINVKENKILKAVFNKKEITLTYNANGGKINGEDSITETAEEKLTTTILSPDTRDGYIFKGWAKNQTATEADYQSGETIEITENKTLYAVWEEQTEQVTIRFFREPNGSPYKTITVDKGSEIELEYPFKTKRGKVSYHQFGWAVAFENEDTWEYYYNYHSDNNKMEARENAYAFAMLPYERNYKWFVIEGFKEISKIELKSNSKWYNYDNEYVHIGNMQEEYQIFKDLSDKRFIGELENAYISGTESSWNFKFHEYNNTLIIKGIQDGNIKIKYDKYVYNFNIYELQRGFEAFYQNVYQITDSDQPGYPNLIFYRVRDVS